MTEGLPLGCLQGGYVKMLNCALPTQQGKAPTPRLAIKIKAAMPKLNIVIPKP